MSRNIKRDFWDTLTEGQKQQLVLMIGFFIILVIWLIQILNGAPIV